MLGPGRGSPPCGVCGLLGVGLGDRRALSAAWPCQQLALPLEVACLPNPCTSARVGRTVGCRSLGRQGEAPWGLLAVTLALCQARGGTGTKHSEK